jgi:hypothetical protein
MACKNALDYDTSLANPMEYNLLTNTTSCDLFVYYMMIAMCTTKCYQVYMLTLPQYKLRTFRGAHKLQ